MTLADTLRAWGASPLFALTPLAFVMVMTCVGAGLAVLVALIAHTARRGLLYGGIGLTVGAVCTSVGLRLVDLATPLLRGGPEGWLRSALGMPSGGWYPADVLGFTLLIHAMLLPAWGLAAGVVSLKLTQRPLRLLGGVRLAVALVLSAWLTQWLLLGPLSRQGASLYALDLTALALVSMITLATAALGADSPGVTPATSRRGALAAPPVARRTPHQAWVELGAVGMDEAPFLHRDATSEPGGTSAGLDAWRRAGGAGAPPHALDALSERVEPWTARYLSDLPAPTSDTLCVAALVVAARSQGRRALVIHPRAAALRDALLSALSAGGGWLPGPISAGLAETREALTRSRMPALAFLSPSDLAGGGLRLLGSAEQGRGWLARVGMIVLPDLDQGSPFLVTQRFFLLRRLHLLLLRAGSAPGFYMSGSGGERATAFARAAFPGLTVRSLPLGLRARPSLHVWLATHRFRTAAGGNWARDAVKSLAQDGLTTHLSDPLGAFSEDDVSAWGTRAQLHRALAFEGRASVALLDEASLIAGCRAADHLAATQSAGAGRSADHHALWGLTDNPVTRFLVKHHGSLARRGRLLPPEPLIGHANRALGRAHLRAATEDAAHPIAALRSVFGDSLCDEVLADAPSQGFLARRGPEGALQRSPVLDQAKPSATHLAATVTPDPVRVVDGETGRTLLEIERLTAPTRMYPRRVFSHQGRRFEVQMHGLDLDRGDLKVLPVRADQPITQPILSASPRLRRVEEDPQRVRTGAHAFSLCTLRVQVHEAIHGVARGVGDVLRFERPVEARYITRARGLFFERPLPSSAGVHLAKAILASLRAHLLAAEDDLEVVPVPAGFVPGQPAGVLILDRHVMGMGAAEALHEGVVRSVLDWTSAILQQCPCERGCASCTPAAVLREGLAAKESVLSVLNP